MKYQYDLSLILKSIMSCQGKCFNTALYSALMVIVVLQLYSTWSLMWLGWNIFVICLYLEVGVLSRSRDLYILNIGTKNKSWWLEHGIGCRIANESWKGDASVESSRPIPPEDVVEGCLLDYYYVEVIHAGVQCLLALMGFVFSCVNIYMYGEDEESSSPANDELEFVKMYQNSSPSRRRNNFQGNDNQTFDDITVTNEYPTLDRPPSYETSMRDSTVVNQIYGADRQSVRSLRSVRSKSSNKSKNRNNDHREELPWVQITPSSSHVDSPFRHYP